MLFNHYYLPTSFSTKYHKNLRRTILMDSLRGFLIKDDDSTAMSFLDFLYIFCLSCINHVIQCWYEGRSYPFFSKCCLLFCRLLSNIPFHSIYQINLSKWVRSSTITNMLLHYICFIQFKSAFKFLAKQLFLLSI